MSAFLKTLLCGLACCCVAAQAQVPTQNPPPAQPPGEAAGLGDPTRPPAALAASAGAAADGAPAEPAGPQLQSILVSREPGGRRVAVINGEMVRQGMKVGGATVERVGETEVVLRRGKSLETLKLFPKQ